MHLFTRLTRVCNQPKIVYGSEILILKRLYPIMTESTLQPPPLHHLKVLDKNEITKKVIIPCIICNEFPSQTLRNLLKPYVLKLPKLKPIVIEDCVRILLNPDKISRWDDFEEKTKDNLESVNIIKDNFKETIITLNYDNWNSDDILRAILPADTDVARSFSKIGHIIHLNLREHLLPFKNIIGEILLDKVPNARTVVNKTTGIDNTYRNFEMELVCGDDDMIADVRENHFKFQFDFSKVYWNPRLSTEHQRVVDFIDPGDVLFDVFCGVGPFAIPCAKKEVQVYANDLNPNCHQWLNHNIKLNKINGKFIRTFNKDASDFIKEDTKKILMTLAKESTFTGKTHVTMNLPAIALTFIKEFCCLFSNEELTIDEMSRVLPNIHVYFFVDLNEANAIEIEFNKLTGIPYDSDKMSHAFVRHVSRNKDMVKVVFIPPISFILDCSNEVRKTIDEPSAKRLCPGISDTTS